MPELPEVETVVRGLRDVLLGRTFRSVSCNAPVSSIELSRSLGKSFERALAGRRVTAINRRGKNILIALDNNSTLWVHLKMTGQFRYVDSNVPRQKHDLVVFVLDERGSDDSDCNLRFNDYRRFGRLRLYPNDELWTCPGLADLGPEPLELPAGDFVELCHRRARQIKPALMDQTFIAGIGNIYADESLYNSRLHPLRLSNSISKRKLIELHGHVQYLLQRSIDMMGTTVDTYSGVNGRPGTFQNYLKAYGREGQPCERCETLIVRKKIGSRSAHYCPRCQRQA
ncbi:MAG: bifunctional DNA-formamidopyrimidine glycosylase/DNA-(apurinic or apyrimidinic site) lyase [candidate division Zixibacteria bacterium]|nr:bifunctional DNA-formamidopyrimidine glycosylase/DNA-(apurinic or apyrimidinic site) lyase [candidate division Zixibacteria bacterium]